MQTKNSILITKIDEEDLWVYHGMVFPVTNTANTVKSLEEIREKLTSEEVIKFVLEANHIRDDYRFYDLGIRGSQVTYLFTNEAGEEWQEEFTAHFVYTFS